MKMKLKTSELLTDISLAYIIAHLSYALYKLVKLYKNVNNATLYKETKEQVIWSIVLTVAFILGTLYLMFKRSFNKSNSSYTVTTAVLIFTVIFLMYSLYEETLLDIISLKNPKDVSTKNKVKLGVETVIMIVASIVTISAVVTRVK